MGRLGVNVKDVETGLGDIPVYPDGLYDVQVKSLKPKNKNGKDLITWLFEVVQHPEYNGQPMFYDTYIHSEAALFKLKRLGVACDAMVDDGKGGQDIDDDLIKGKVIKVNVTTVTHRQDTGAELAKPRNEVEVVI